MRSMASLNLALWQAMLILMKPSRPYILPPLIQTFSFSIRLFSISIEGMSMAVTSTHARYVPSTLLTGNIGSSFSKYSVSIL